MGNKKPLINDGYTMHLQNNIVCKPLRIILQIEQRVLQIKGDDERNCFGQVFLAGDKSSPFQLSTSPHQ
jgi:hypothetical protein